MCAIVVNTSREITTPSDVVGAYTTPDISPNTPCGHIRWISHINEVMRERSGLKFRIGFLLLLGLLCTDSHGAPKNPVKLDQPEDHQELTGNVPDIFDPKHGVKMGIPLRVCDDGIHGIEMDWDPRSTEEYACHRNDLINMNYVTKDITDITQDQAMHICLDESIVYPTVLPLSGSHRPLWPVFGEYRYLPPQRWVHSLEHGAVALLYHPCMQRSPELAALKSLVRDCLGKHVITPYRKIPFNMPFALLTYKHARLMGLFDPQSEHDVDIIIGFIKRYALEGPESHVLDNGQYSAGLIRNATDFSDLQEDKLSLCAFLR